MVTTGGGPVQRIAYEKVDIEKKEYRIRRNDGRTSGLNIG
jgi:hypothetical protein